MDFGMPFLLETDTVESCISLCDRLGLQFIEWNMNFPQCQVANFDIKQLNYFRTEKNIYYTLHLDENFNISDFNDKIRNAYLATFSEAIALAKAIDVPIINMHLAKGIYITLPERKEYLFHMFKEHYFKRILEFQAICEKLLCDSKILIAIENTDGFAPHEQEAIELLLESKCFGLTLDIGHSHAANNVDIPFYKKHIDRLCHMHTHDGKANKNHLAFGDGEIDLKQRLEMARKANARIVLEIKTVEALTKTVERKETVINL